jgi:hypothetical protein
MVARALAGKQPTCQHERHRAEEERRPWAELESGWQDHAPVRHREQHPRCSQHRPEDGERDGGLPSQRPPLHGHRPCRSDTTTSAGTGSDELPTT